MEKEKVIETIEEFMQEEGLLDERDINTTDEEIEGYELLERLKDKFRTN